MTGSSRPRRIVVLLAIASIGTLSALPFLAIHLSSEAARDQAKGQVAAAAAASSTAIQREVRGMSDVVASVAGGPALAEAMVDGDPDLGARALAKCCRDLERGARAGDTHLVADALPASMAWFVVAKVGLCAEFVGVADLPPR